MPTRSRRVLPVVLAVALCAVLAAVGWVVFGGGDSSPDESGPAPPPTAGPDGGRPSPPPAEPVPVTVIKIDNATQARPQSGLDLADVVYVEPVEGGFTRLVAVYSSELPEAAGPVRSARETDIELLAQYGHPALVFSGAAPEIESALGSSAATLVRRGEYPDGFYREPDRPAPHNLYATPQALPRGSGPGPTHVLPRGEAPAGGQPTGEYTAAFERGEYHITWSPESRRWSMTLDGAPVTSVGAGPVNVETVVVQYVDVGEGADVHDASGASSPVARTVGTGPVTMLRDGRAFDGTWSRPTARDGTRFTTSAGKELPLADGPVWVLLVPR